MEVAEFLRNEFDYFKIGDWFGKLILQMINNEPKDMWVSNTDL